MSAYSLSLFWLVWSLTMEMYKQVCWMSIWKSIQKASGCLGSSLWPFTGKLVGFSTMQAQTRKSVSVSVTEQQQQLFIDDTAANMGFGDLCAKLSVSNQSSRWHCTTHVFVWFMSKQFISFTTIQVDRFCLLFIKVSFKIFFQFSYCLSY